MEIAYRYAALVAEERSSQESIECIVCHIQIIQRIRFDRIDIHFEVPRLDYEKFSEDRGGVV